MRIFDRSRSFARVFRHTHWRDSFAV